MLTDPGEPEPERLMAFSVTSEKATSSEPRGIDHSLIGKQYHTYSRYGCHDHNLCPFAFGGAVYFKGEQAVLVLVASKYDSLHTGVSNAFLTHSKHQYFLEFGADGLQEKLPWGIFGLLDKHRILVIEDVDKDLQEEIITP